MKNRRQKLFPNPLKGSFTLATFATQKRVCNAKTLKKSTAALLALAS
jgi:hypothetical protein